MGKCLQSQERIMILGTCSILAQPDVRVPLCQGRHLWHHPVLQQLEQGGGGEEQQPVTACPGEAASLCASSSSSGVGRSPLSAARLPSVHSLHKALPPPPHNIPLCHGCVIIHFFLPYCCLIRSINSDASELANQPRRPAWLLTSRNCCCVVGHGNCAWVMYWKCFWQTSSRMELHKIPGRCRTAEPAESNKKLLITPST